MAGGILWHLAAALVCAWLGFLYVRGRGRAEEIEEAVLALLARPCDAPAPSAALVRRALRFCEGEYEDVLGTAVRLEPPEPHEASRAVADLLGRLARVRNAGTLGNDDGTLAPLVAGSVRGQAPAGKAHWDGARWTRKETA